MLSRRQPWCLHNGYGTEQHSIESTRVQSTMPCSNKHNSVSTMNEINCPPRPSTQRREEVKNENKDTC